MTSYLGSIDPAQIPNGNYTASIIATDNSTNHNVSQSAPIGITVTGVTIPETPVDAPPGRPTIQVQIAFGQGPFTVAPNWTDVTSDVLLASGINIVRGATANNPTPTPGTVSLTLRDTQRKYDPENPASPYYGKLTADCPLRVRGLYRGLGLPLVDGSSIVSDDPIVGTEATTAVPLGFGYVDGFPQTYADPADNVVMIPISAPDGLSILARASFMPVSPFTCAGDLPGSDPIVSTDPLVNGDLIVPGGTWPDWQLCDTGAVVADPIPSNPQELSGDRIRILCELAGIPDDYLDIDAGQSVVEGGEPQEKNLLDHFRTITATEYGRFFQRADGVISFRERHSASSSPKADFSEATGTGVPYASLKLDPADRRFLVNRCIRGSQTVAPVTAQDDASIAKYGVFEDSQTGYAFSNPQDAIDQANYIVARFAEPQPRITGLTVKPDRDVPKMFPAVLQGEIGDVNRVFRTPLGFGAEIIKIVTAEQLQHQFDSTQWTESIDAGEADTAPYFTADDPVLGLVDAGNLAAY